MNLEFFNKYIVEFLGTFLLSLTIFTTGGNFLAIGAALAIAVFFGGKISGGAFNPAIAICFAVANKISYNDLIPYLVVEILGGLVGYFLALRLIK